jgi:ribosomal protein L18
MTLIIWDAPTLCRARNVGQDIAKKALATGSEHGVKKVKKDAMKQHARISIAKHGHAHKMEKSKPNRNIFILPY